jgi:integrase
MGIMKIGEKYYVSFKWKGNRIRTVTPATNATDAKRTEKAVKTAFKIGSYGHLDPEAQEVIVRTYQNNGWVLPPELSKHAIEEDVTLISAVKSYLSADPKHRTERNLYAIDRLIEHFGEDIPIKDIKVPRVRRYQKERQKTVANATINREVAVLSGILRVQVELEIVDFNPCMLVKRLPANQRDSYLSWEDFNNLLEHSWWLHDILVTLYYTGMRFNEVVSLRWEMYKPERRMLILPPDLTKEGKNPKKAKLRPKRIPLRQEVIDILKARRKGDGQKVVKAMGLIFTYSGRFQTHSAIYQGKPVDRSMIRKAWDRAKRLSGLGGLQVRDFRHTWKTNAQRSGMDPTVRNIIVGHSSERSVEDRYIRVSDEELLRAIDEMSFDNGCTELDWVEEA